MTSSRFVQHRLYYTIELLFFILSQSFHDLGIDDLFPGSQLARLSHLTTQNNSPRSHLREDYASLFFPFNTQVQVSRTWLDQQANLLTNHLYILLIVHLLKCANFPNLCDRKIQANPLQGKMLTLQCSVPPISLSSFHSFL